MLLMRTKWTCYMLKIEKNHSGSKLDRSEAGFELTGSRVQVPFWQAKIVQGCRKRGKPVIVATNMLESMITNPTPTRAEVRSIVLVTAFLSRHLRPESAHPGAMYRSIPCHINTACCEEGGLPNSRQLRWSELNSCSTPGERHLHCGTRGHRCGHALG